MVKSTTVFLSAVGLTMSAIGSLLGYAVYLDIKGNMAWREFNARHKECCKRLETEMLKIAKATDDVVMITLEDKLMWCQPTKQQPNVMYDQVALSEYISMNLFKNDTNGAKLHISKICQGIKE